MSGRRKRVFRASRAFANAVGATANRWPAPGNKKGTLDKKSVGSGKSGARSRAEEAERTAILRQRLAGFPQTQSGAGISRTQRRPAARHLRRSAATCILRQSGRPADHRLSGSGGAAVLICLSRRPARIGPVERQTTHDVQASVAPIEQEPRGRLPHCNRAQPRPLA